MRVDDIKCIMDDLITDILKLEDEYITENNKDELMRILSRIASLQADLWYYRELIVRGLIDG